MEREGKRGGKISSRRVSLKIFLRDILASSNSFYSYGVLLFIRAHRGGLPFFQRSAHLSVAFADSISLLPFDNKFLERKEFPPRVITKNKVRDRFRVVRLKLYNEMKSFIENFNARPQLDYQYFSTSCNRISRSDRFSLFTETVIRWKKIGRKVVADVLILPPP